MHSLTRTLVAGPLHKEKHLLRQRLSDQMPDKNAAVDEWSPQASLYTDSLPLNLRKAVNKILWEMPVGSEGTVRGTHRFAERRQLPDVLAALPLVSLQNHFRFARAGYRPNQRCFLLIISYQRL